MFKELRTLPGKFLMKVTVSILLSHVFLMIHVAVTSVVDKNGFCEAAAVFFTGFLSLNFSG